ncbi:hypothetical protein ACFHWD_04380 [Clostridium sp. MT-14]|uniref:hypothetical protein n=1 Tax=Clostridium sp. MT-14 TaxID=3348360 RepID=UPI0035F33F46
MEKSDVLKDLLDDVNNALALIQSNMIKRTVSQLYELHGKLTILIKLREHNKNSFSITPEDPYYITYRGHKVSDTIIPNK